MNHLWVVLEGICLRGKAVSLCRFQNVIASGTTQTERCINISSYNHCLLTRTYQKCSFAVPQCVLQVFVYINIKQTWGQRWTCRALALCVRVKTRTTSFEFLSYGQSILLIQLINPNFLVSLSHRRSTKVFLEAYPFISKKIWFCPLELSTRYSLVRTVWGDSARFLFSAWRTPSQLVFATV